MLSNRNPVGVKFANVSFRVARFVSTDLVSRTLYLALSVAPALASFLGFLLGAPLSFSEGASWGLPLLDSYTLTLLHFVSSLWVPKPLP